MQGGIIDTGGLSTRLDRIYFWDAEDDLGHVKTVTGAEGLEIRVCPQPQNKNMFLWHFDTPRMATNQAAGLEILFTKNGPSAPFVLKLMGWWWKTPVHHQAWWVSRKILNDRAPPTAGDGPEPLCWE